MRWEERLIWLLNQALTSLDTNGGHLAILGLGCLLALKYYPLALAPLGSALFIKIRQ